MTPQHAWLVVWGSMVSSVGAMADAPPPPVEISSTTHAFVFEALPSSATRHTFGAISMTLGDGDVHLLAWGIVGKPRTPGLAPRAAAMQAERTGIVMVRDVSDKMALRRMIDVQFEGIAALWRDVKHVHRGEQDGEEFGATVFFEVDLNGDGVADLLVGAPGWDKHRGRVYAFCGDTHRRLFTVEGRERGERFGASVRAFEDVTGDGVPDFAVGAPHCSFRAQLGGRVDIFSGADRACVRRITGRKPTERFGLSINDVTLDFVFDAHGGGGTKT